MKSIMKFISRQLLLALAIAVFVCLVISLGVGATFLLAFIGRWIGIGKDVFVYAFQIIAIWNVWNALAWVVGHIPYRKDNINE